MTFPSYITVHDKSIKVHYIKKEKHLLGLKEMRLQDGTTMEKASKWYFYAEEIEYNDLINAINKVGEIFDN